MKVTVNACRKKRVKVDVNAVTSRRDVVRIPVKPVAITPEPEPENSLPASAPENGELDLSAVFSSAVFERAEAEETDRLPEVFVKPVRLLNKLADTRPEPDELPRYFDPREMTAEEEAKAYRDPVKLVDGTGEPADSAAGKTEERAKTAVEASEAIEAVKTVKQNVKSGKKDKKSAKPDESAASEDYTTEELIAIIDRQQRDKTRRDLERAALEKERREERAKRAEQESVAARGRKPTREEISRDEDTLFSWWSELDSRDAVEDAPETEAEEAFTQMQITGDIPVKRPQRPKPPVSSVPEEVSSEQEDVSSVTDEYVPEPVEFDSFDDDLDISGGHADDEEDYAVLSDDFADGYEDGFEDDFDDDEFGEYADGAEGEFYDYEAEEDVPDDDTSVNVRYFDRDNEGERVEVERSAAVGQEVVVIDNESGRMKRICGIIKRGGSRQDAPDSGAEDRFDDDVDDIDAEIKADEGD